MAKKAGQVVINLSAGTAQFVQDLEKSNASLKRFGQYGVEANKHMVSSMQASSAAIRELEGNFTNNIRAVERFVGLIPGIAPLLQNAFPLIGGIAFAGLVVEIGGRFAKFVQEVQYGSEIIRAAYVNLNAPLRLTNDELAVANDRLEMDIAKLEGRRQNTLKIALDEAKSAADNLADSLEKDLQLIYKVLKEKNIGILNSVLTGRGSTTEMLENIFGKTGFGGFESKVVDIANKARERLDSAKNKTDIQGIQQASKAELDAEFEAKFAEIQRWKQKLSAYKPTAGAEGRGRSLEDSLAGAELPKDNTETLRWLDELARVLRQRKDVTEKMFDRADLQGKKDDLIAGRNNDKLDKPFRDKMADLEAQAQEAELRSKAVGLPEYEAQSLESYANAVKIIQEVNKQLEIHKKELTEDQKGQIISAVATVDHIKAETAFAKQLHDTAESIDRRIQEQQLLTAAIGQGYEATKKAYVDSQLLELRKAHPDRPESDFDEIRAKKAAEFESQHALQVKNAVTALQQQVQLEQQLARVQSQGEEAVRRVALAYKLRELYSKSASQAEIQAELDLYVAQSKNSGAKRLAELDQQIAGVKRLTAAVLGGAEAQRRAAETNQIAEIRRRGGPNVETEVEKQRQLNAIEHQRAILQEAIRTGIQYQDQLESLDQQIGALRAEEAAGRGNLAVAISLRNLENERLKTLANQLLAMGGYRNAMRAFFLEMQQQGNRVARAIHDAMDQAFNGVADNFARLLTGQKSSFGKLFQSIGESLISAVIKQGIQAGIKAIGNTSIGRRLGIGGRANPTGSQTDPIWTKRDGPLGTEADPIWVMMANGYAPAVIPAIPGVIGSGVSVPTLPIPAGNFGLSGARASGGDIDSSGAYLVGENGPEILAGVNGRVFSNSQSQNMLGGSGHTYNLAIDARGADEAAIYRRVYSAVVAAHKSAVGTAVQVNTERMKRTPQ